jgi:hypothetical protein
MPCRPRAPFVALALGIACAPAPREAALEPYFLYETGPRAETSEWQMSLSALEQLDQDMFDVVASSKPDATQAARYYAAVTVAQRDAAALAYGATQRYQGDLGTVTAVVTCQHFPARCDGATSRDPLSTELADLVTAHVGERLARDGQTVATYTPPDGSTSDRPPFKGIDAGAWAPWLVEDPRRFRLAGPPAIGSAADLAQVAGVRAASQRALSDVEKTNIAYWAGGPGTKTIAGVWLQIASDRLELTGATLPRVLFVRSVVAMAAADASIAAMDSKYTWWAKRPFARDATLQTFLPTPSTPSYPSDSIAVSAAAARVLAVLLPDASSGVDAMVDDAARSRIQAGIHFPIDVEAAKGLGVDVADAALRRAAGPDVPR